MGLDQLASQLPQRPRGLRQGVPGDGAGLMTPAKQGGGKGGGKRKPKADDTREYELGDDFLSDIDDEEEVGPEGVEDEDFDEEYEEDLEEEDFDDEEELEDEEYEEEELDDE